MGKDGSTTGTNFGKGGENGQGGEMGGANSGPNTSGGGAGYHGNGIASSDQRFTPKPSSAMKYLTHTREGLKFIVVFFFEELLFLTFSEFTYMTMIQSVY